MIDRNEGGYSYSSSSVDGHIDATLGCSLQGLGLALSIIHISHIIHIIASLWSRGFPRPSDGGAPHAVEHKLRACYIKDHEDSSLISATPPRVAETYLSPKFRRKIKQTNAASQPSTRISFSFKACY